MLFMFIIANLDIIAMALLVAAPFYFFNRYLVKKIKPSESGKRLVLYFINVVILEMLYSIIGVLIMVWLKYRS
jgi:hypothetical protein